MTMDKTREYALFAAQGRVEIGLAERQRDVSRDEVPAWIAADADP